MPNIPLVDIANRRVAAVRSSPGTAVVIGDITQAVDGVRQDFFVEMSAKERRYELKSTAVPKRNLRREGSLPEIGLVVIIVDFQVEGFRDLVIFVVAGEQGQRRMVA